MRKLPLVIFVPVVDGRIRRRVDFVQNLVDGQPQIECGTNRWRQHVTELSRRLFFGHPHRPVHSTLAQYSGDEHNRGLWRLTTACGVTSTTSFARHSGHANGTDKGSPPVAAVVSLCSSAFHAASPSECPHSGHVSVTILATFDYLGRRAPDFPALAYFVSPLRDHLGGRVTASGFATPSRNTRQHTSSARRTCYVVRAGYRPCIASRQIFLNSSVKS